jgi:hypothetical protein
MPDSWAPLLEELRVHHVPNLCAAAYRGVHWDAMMMAAC